MAIPLYDLIEVPIHELKDEVQALILVPNHFFELDDVVVVESTEYLNFSKVHRLLPGCTLRLHVFNGDYLISELVSSFGNTAIRAISDSPYSLIFLHLCVVSSLASLSFSVLFVLISAKVI